MKYYWENVKMRKCAKCRIRNRNQLVKVNLMGIYSYNRKKNVIKTIIHHEYYE